MSNKRKRERQPRGKAFAGKRKKDTNDENWVWNGLVLTQRTLSIECPKDSIVFKSFWWVEYLNPIILIDCK